MKSNVLHKGGCWEQETGGFRNVAERTLYLEPYENSLDEPSALLPPLSRLFSSVQVRTLGSNTSKHPFPQPQDDQYTGSSLSRISSMPSNDPIRKHQLSFTRTTDTAPTLAHPLGSPLLISRPGCAHCAQQGRIRDI
jgi:hypothetical protein